MPGCTPPSRDREECCAQPQASCQERVARRNAKLTARRELVSPGRAILAVDLAPGAGAAVCDHDSVVPGRRVFTGSAWCIEQIVAEPAAARAGFAGLVLACEPARHPWKPLVVTAGEASL